MNERLDKDGLTEQEFLKSYDSSRYPKPSLTADNLIIAQKPCPTLLLIRRGGHPFLGSWALPGGFAEPGERIEETAARELEEETQITGLPLQAVGFYSKPGRDPRGWSVTRSFVALLEERPTYQASDDAREAAFFALELAKKDGHYTAILRNGEECLKAEADAAVKDGPIGELRTLTNVKGSGLAFDHAEIILDALLALEKEGRVRFAVL